MQYLDINDTKQWQVLQLTKYILLVAACLLLWFLPSTHLICNIVDTKAFEFLNASLTYSHAWQLFWGYLNHPVETWLNVVVMIAINILGIFTLPSFRRRKALAGVIYFWLFFQLVLFFTHKIFADWIEVQRASPSMVITPWVVLSDTLNLENLKVYSNTCFPAGHALVAIFWAQFTMLYSKNWVHYVVLITVFALILPRLFSGAHWLSDIIFTICYALLCYTIAIGTPLYGYATKQLENVINFIKPLKRAEST